VPNTNNLEIDLVGVEADTSGLVPRLLLRFEAEATGREDFQIHGWEFAASVEFEKSSETRGLPSPKLEPLPPRSIARSGNEKVFEAYIELEQNHLEAIEDLRESGGLLLRADVSLAGTGAKDDEGYSYQERNEYNLQDAVWREMLTEFGYHDTRSFDFDLGVAEAQVRDSLSTAHARVERAQERHDAGDYPSSIRLCRDAIESLSHVEHAAQKIVDDQKWELVEDHMGQFKSGFVGRLSHSEDMTGTEPALRRDSDLVLGITKSFLRFIATAVEEQ
jgi:hypothetical protein